jgi:hypothetical protein
LVPQQTAEVYLGDHLLASGPTDDAGNAQIEVVIPSSSRQGARQITVLIPDTSVSTGCVARVNAPVLSPATSVTLEPPPNAFGWNDSDVTATLKAIDMPEGPGIQQITYSLSGAQTSDSTIVHGDSATVRITAEGETTVTFFATNNAGISETPQHVTVKIDQTKPTSQVLALSATQLSPSFQVQWSGTDEGAGILDYTIFVSEDGGAFTPFLRETTSASATFTGQLGKAYAFYSVARDQTGNVEDVPSGPDTTTRVTDVVAVVNDELSAETGSGISNPTPVPDGPAGTFSFTSEFCNIGTKQLTALKSMTTTLTGGNILLNRDSGTPPGVGSELTFPANGGYADLKLDPNECVDVSYTIGLATDDPFDFFVDVVGIASEPGTSSSLMRAEVGTYRRGRSSRSIGLIRERDWGHIEQLMK